MKEGNKSKVAKILLQQHPLFVVIIRLSKNIDKAINTLSR